MNNSTEQGFKIFGKKIIKTVQASVEAICPILPELDEKDIIDKIIFQIDEYLSTVPSVVRKLIIYDFFFLNLSTIIFCFSYKTFKKLGLHQRREFYEKTIKSRFSFKRQPLKRIKNLIQMHYFDRHDVCNLLDYPVDKYIKGKIRERKKIVGKENFKIIYD